MRQLYKASVSWGFPVYIIASLTYLLSILYIYFMFQLEPDWTFFIFFLPFAALDMIFFQVIKDLALRTINRPYSPFILYDQAIDIKGKFLRWADIKSISFQTGRLVHDYTFMEGMLPALQRIFVLDKEGNEYSCIIDIDYFLKENRKKNNLVVLKEMLHDSGKGQLLSDWAELR